MIWRPASGTWTTERIDCRRVIRITPAIVPEKGAAAAEDAGAAEDHRRDRRKEIGVAHGLVGVGRVAGEQHAGERGAGAGDGKAGDDHAAGVDTGEIGRRLAIADGVDAAAKDGPASTAPRRTRRRSPRPTERSECRIADRPTAMRCIVAVERSCGAKPAGVDDHQSLGDGVGAEGEDHRGHAKVGDANAIDEADAKAARDTDRDGQRVPTCPQPAAAVDIMPPMVTTQGIERSMWPSRMTSIRPEAMMPRNEATWSCCSR